MRRVRIDAKFNSGGLGGHDPPRSRRSVEDSQEPHAGKPSPPSAGSSSSKGRSSRGPAKKVFSRRLACRRALAPSAVERTPEPGRWCSPFIVTVRDRHGEGRGARDGPWILPAIFVMSGPRLPMVQVAEIPCPRDGEASADEERWHADSTAVHQADPARLRPRRATGRDPVESARGRAWPCPEPP